ncbi:MAG: hypothetical protein ACRBFS_26560 [Aureispira sp.]
MSYVIIKLEDRGEDYGYVTFNPSDRTFSGGGTKEDAVRLEAFAHSSDKEAYYYKVKGTKKEYMDVKTADNSKVKGNQPWGSGKGTTAAWIMIEGKLSTFQGGKTTRRFLSRSNKSDNTNQLYANLTGMACKVTLERVEEKKS